MLTKIITLLALTGAIRGNSLHYEKPKLERNNIINKGIWVRSKLTENMVDKTRMGKFIFRENSLDVDHLLENTFDTFGTTNNGNELPVPNYIKRAKRAIRRIRAQKLEKNLKNCIGKECKTLEQENEEQSKGAVKRDNRDERNSSSVNNYPYEVAILLNNKKRDANTPNNTQTLENEINNNHILSKVDDIVQTTTLSRETDFVENNTTFHKIPTNANSPRSVKYDLESEIIKKFELTEDMNRTHDNFYESGNKITDRNIFDKDNTVWHQNAPIPNVNVYKVVPKEPQKSKTVTERGLIKVISMLTKTFKKIIKQHNEIKQIHDKITDVNDQFINNSDAITTKFQDFDVKYLYILKLHEKLRSLEQKLASKQEYFQNKEKEMSANFKEFETQQKKFLQQQRQFYNIQKLMLAQNEKVNLKQNTIAKTQSEISHRQNNFARILKKAKQLYLETRHPISKPNSNLIKTLDHPKSTTQNPYISTTTPSSESIKINLFSIPTSNKIENQDELIIKEKDDQTIDDLVYKYYFNNTFIDNIMKNNILNGLMGVSKYHPGVVRNVKSKRNELETTMLLPIFENNEPEAIVTKNRERRWINHHSRHRGKRRERGKGGVVTMISASDAKAIRKNVNNIAIVDETPKAKDEGDIKVKYDPFLAMATNFCNEIRQNTTAQMLQWCVEKALRRLRFLDKDHEHTTRKPKQRKTDSPKLSYKWKPKKLREHTRVKTLSIEMNNEPSTEPITEPSTEPIAEPTTKPIAKPTTEPKRTVLNVVTESPTSTAGTKVVTETTVTDTPSTQTQLSSTKVNTTLALVTQPEIASSISDTAAFFPDNEMLESNLQQFDEKPDTEGNVYYDGSLHASDILDSESQGIDDIMPGIESNSRIDMDPMAYDLQAQRRAFVRKLNEKIKMSGGLKSKPFIM